MNVKKWLRLAGANLVVSFCAKGFAFADNAIHQEEIKVRYYALTRFGYGFTKEKLEDVTFSLKRPYDASVEIGGYFGERFCLGVEAGAFNCRTKEKTMIEEDDDGMGGKKKFIAKLYITGWMGFGAINATYCQPISEDFFGYIGVGVGGAKSFTKVKVNLMGLDGSGREDHCGKCSGFSMFEQAFAGLGVELAENCYLRVGYRFRYFNRDFTYKGDGTDSDGNVKIKIKPIHIAEIGVHFVF